MSIENVGNIALTGVAQLVGVSFRKVNGGWFNSHSGRVLEATAQCFSPSFSPSLLFSLKINK